MSNWKGIIGKGFRPLEFHDYVSKLKFDNWRPQFVVLHNTSEPRLSQWHSTPGEQRMLNLQDFYRDQQKWSAGPHLFIADDLIWVFTPITVSGTHSPSWNAISWGVEMVGEYEEEPFGTGVRENTIDALATLHAFAGLDPAGIRFHKEDPKTTHKECPGEHVSKPDIISAVTDRLSSREAGEHVADHLTRASAPSGGDGSGGNGDQIPNVDNPVLKSDLLQGNNILEAVADGHLVLHATGGRVEGIGPVQDALNQLGFTIDLGSSGQFKGFFGEKTQAALMAFQQATPGILNPTGIVDQDTLKALDAALLDHGEEVEPPVAADGIKLLTKGKVVATLKEKPGGSGALRSVDILQLSGRVGFYYKAAMAIDVDGSPRAYTQDATSPKPLDSLESVDSEGIETMYVQQRSKTVRGVTQVGEGPFKDFFVSRTSLLFKRDETFKTSNFVDAEQIPYIIFPRNQGEPAVFSEVSLGDMAYVIDLKTGRTTHAILADTNPKVGEASLRVALNLGRSDLNAGNGEEEDRFLYILFPATKFDPEPTVPHWPDAKIKEEADKAFTAWGGMDQVRTLFPKA